MCVCPQGGHHIIGYLEPSSGPAPYQTCSNLFTWGPSPMHVEKQAVGLQLKGLFVIFPEVVCVEFGSNWYNSLKTKFTDDVACDPQEGYDWYLPVHR